MENKAHYFEPDWAVHPGVILKEKLAEMDMSLKEFSVRIGKPEQSLLEVIDGTASVTPELAVLFETVLGIPVTFWRDLQWDYDVRKITAQQAEKQQERNAWLVRLPLEEMQENGWLKDYEGSEDIATRILRFFGVVSPEAWENYYLKQRLKVAFRITLNGTFNPTALSAWLRRGELQAQQIWVEPVFSKKNLRDSMEKIAAILCYPDDDVMDNLQVALEDLGIKLFYTEPLSEVPIKGASRWIYGYPCIQLPKTQETYDNFRTTILHELGHILLHGKKDIFLEQAGYIADNPESHNQKEAEADAFAKKWMAWVTQYKDN